MMNERIKKVLKIRHGKDTRGLYPLTGSFDRFSDGEL
jgi:hypothetical protein